MSRTPGLAFTVYGVAAPAGSKTVATAKSGRQWVRDSSKRSYPWKQQVAQAAGEAMVGRDLWHGPVELVVRFYVPRPKSHYGAKGLRPVAPSYPTVAPDVTKLLRAVEDALKGIVWRDDSQVVIQHAWKRYGEPARCEVALYPVLPDRDGAPAR